MKFLKLVMAVQVVGLALVTASAQVGNCPSRPVPGTPIANPLDLYSQNGTLNVALALNNGLDSEGYTHDCYNYATGSGTIEAPTLRLNPGDTLNLTLTNQLNLPVANAAHAKHPMHMGPMTMAPMKMSKSPSDTSCNGGTITQNSTNLHFHGLNIPPVCHQDDVINTLIQPTDPPFQYQIQIPSNEPPGLYWYHPHPHGFTTNQVNGGASGALIVGGIENVKPQVAGLTEQVLLVRQQFLNPGSWLPGPYETTLNFETVVTPPLHSLPLIVADPGEQQFWRVLNASTQGFLSLQIAYNGAPQSLELISVDAVPVTGNPYVTTINIPPAGRAEFVMTGPPEGANAIFVDLGFNTGPVGNPNPAQVLANIVSSSDAVKRNLHVPPKHSIPAAKVPPAARQRFANLATAKVTAARSLYFSEATEGTNGPTNYFITVQGQTPAVFNPALPPAIVTNVGAVEDWTIENHSSEEHAFHMHQIHFLVMAINGKPLQTPVMQDTVLIPYWDGKSPYPSVKVRMDFRDPEIAGTFVYHCHVLDHEDGGMMAEIQVNP
ncbi:MAG: multicopper oxidase domain-containing protein [Terriglobales bacterium]|jgi:FtsP/CotA-like multicopper oxidase with cupredoxin domain